MAAEFRCTECGWEGDADQMPYRNPQNAESQYCPSCEANAGPDGCMALIEDDTPASASLIDAAIAVGSVLDPAGNRKAAEHLRVPSWEEKEAERKRLAERIASMWGR